MLEAITLERYQIQELMTDCMELGAKKALVATGVLSQTVSKSEAIRIADSRSLIERWIKEGLLGAHQDGGKTSKLRIDRLQLDILLKTANRSTYLTVIERKQS